MQEEVTSKTIALAIKTAKLDGKMLQAALRQFMQLYRKKRDTPHRGKQTLKQLMRHGTGVSNIEITDANMLIIQDQVWNRVTLNRNAGVSTWYYADEFHLLLKEPQTAAYSAEIWKRFRKWGGVPTGATQNVKDLLSSPEIENILENSDYICMLNQAAGDRKILAERLNISSEQLKYVTNSAPGEGLLFFENVILPFVDHFPKDTELYRIMSTKPSEVNGQ